MAVEASLRVWRFDRFRLDLARGALFHEDGAEIPLRPKALALLRHLVENAGRLVDRDEIMRVVWPGVIVTEDSIAQCVKQIRQALGDDEMRLLRTLPRRGFLFASETATAEARGPAPAPTPPGAAPLGPAPLAPAPAADRPTLVVLPFANMTADPEQEYFADGITEELTTALSHLRWFSVIARNSAFTYKGRAGVDVRQVGRELGAGYALEGSVRRAGGTVRITAQLCEAATGRHVWAERFDGDIADVFGLQDRVTEAVACAIEPSLREAEVERIRTKPTESLTAYDLYLRALPHRFATREGNEEAMRLLRCAIAIDPGFAAAKGALAGQFVLRVTQGWAAEGEREEGVRHAREVVEGRGGAEDPSVLAWAAHALAFLGRDYEGGLAASNRAVRLAPNSGLVLYLGGWNRLYVGDWRTAVAWIERAVRLSPVDPGMSYFTAALGAAQFVGEQYEEALEWLRRAIHDHPGYLVAHRLLAAGLAQLDRLEEAREAVRVLLRDAAPGYTLAAAAAHNAFRGLARERFLDGLRRAGLPE
jgi:TolB-like protein/DNA-binding winged helix-turn-helix (wHTH) protein